MRKRLSLIFAGAFALIAIVSCSDKEEEINIQENEHDDAYYAAQATVTSSDANFTANGNDGTIQFKTEGGTVTLNVSCGCEWIVENTASDLFATTISNTSVTVTAVQNTVEEDLTGTITLKTANQRITFATITVNQTAYGAPEISVETTEWNFPAVGALSTEIAVEASADWKAESADEWLTVVKTDTGLSLTAAKNEENATRSTTITLTCTDGIRTAYEYISASQDGKVYLSLSSESISLATEAGSFSVTVESNFEWDYSYDTSNGWLTVTRDGNTLTATATENEATDDRESVVTLTAGDGVENVIEVQLPIAQAGNTALILTLSISNANTSTQLPLYGTVDCVVDWGDGSGAETVTTTLPEHTYADEGVYDVIIKGTVTALYSKDLNKAASHNTTITAVKQWGKTGLTDMQYAFYYCENLATLPENTGNSFADVTDFEYAFYECPALEKIPVGIFDDCEGVISFACIFYNCSKISVIPTGLFDNCPAVESFASVFYNFSEITVIPTGLFDNCPAVTDFSRVFYGCSSLTEIPTGLFDNCHSVTNFKSVIYGCSGIEEIPAGLFDNCPEVTDFSYAFFNCSSLKTVPAGLFNYFTNVTTFYDTFYQCTALEEIPAGLFSNCPAVTTFYKVFYGCTSLTTLPAGLFNNCTKVDTFESAFQNCSALTAIPEGGIFVNCNSVTTFKSAFQDCTALATIPTGLFDSCTEVDSFYYTFRGCKALTIIPAGLFDSCSKVTTFLCLFYNCSLIDEIPEGLFDSCTEVTVYSQVFYGCTGITSVPSGLFSHSLLVKNFSSLFYNCTNLTGESPYDLIDVNGEQVKVHLYERADYTDIYTAPSTTSSCFKNCTGLDDYYDIPSAWGGGGN